MDQVVGQALATFRRIEEEVPRADAKRPGAGSVASLPAVAEPA